MKYTFLYIACSLLLFSCSTPESKKFSYEDLKKIYSPQYADGFELYAYGEKSSVLIVKAPWQESGGTELAYFICGEEEEAPADFPGVVIKKNPLKRVVCMSSSYTAFLDALGVDDAIVGLSGTQYVSNKKLQARIARGKVRDVGYESGLNYELLTNLAPDVLFIYGITGENSVITDKVKEMGINVVYIGDYLENSPLGKAEWLVVMGEFFGKRSTAEAIFNSIASEYERVKKIAVSAKENPTVMLNSPWRDTWFVPGDKSYMVRLINDAGGDYVCKGDNSDKSRPISIETAYVNASVADFWLNPNEITSLDELISKNPKFKDVPSVLTGNVYNNNARQGTMGGSDFWESGTVSPQIILRDMIKILHPELLPEHELYYFQKLK